MGASSSDITKTILDEINNQNKLIMVKLNKNQIERFSRQIILRNIGTLGQKKNS